MAIAQKILSLFQSDKFPIDEESLVAVVDKRIKNSENYLQAYHRTWFTNIAMRRGLQYIQTDMASRITFEDPSTQDRVRMVINKMVGIHQSRVAKITKDMPKLEVIPGSAQDEDKDLARKGTKLLAWFWQKENMVEKILDTAGWCVDIGNCFWHIYWNAEKDETMEVPKRHEGPITGKESYKIDAEGYILDENGQREIEEIPQGDVEINLVPSFSIINDGVSTTVQDHQWIGISQAMSLSDIRFRWSERGEKVQGEKDMRNRLYYQQRLISMVGNQHTFFSQDFSPSEPMAIVNFMYEKKSSRYPKGRRMITAGGILLEAGNMPYAHGLYPIIKFSDIQVSGAFWDLSTMENCVPPQKGFNRTISQIIENGNDLGNIKIVLTKGHGLTKDAYDDSGSEMLELNEGHSITQLQPAALPSHVINQLQWFDKAFEDVSGMHEVSSGRVPKGVKSGIGIMALQEQDDTRLAPTKIRFMRCIEEAGLQILQLYAEHQEEERTYQIIGSNPADIDEFKMTKKEIKSMKKDVRIQSENVIAAHKRLQQEQVFDMYKEGLFGDPKNPDVRKHVLKLLEFGSLSEIFDDVDLDTAQARRENDQFINYFNLQRVPHPNDPNQMVVSLPAYDFEDHEIHIQTHNKLRKSPRYRQMTTELRQGLDFHVKVHENFLKSKQPTPQMVLPPGPPPIPMGVIPPAGAIPPEPPPHIGTQVPPVPVPEGAPPPEIGP